jgi:hypothetical protein
MDKEPLVEKYGSTIPMLMNYMHLGIISRSFMLNRHREDLKSLKENENHGKNDELTEFLIYKEMFERVCVAIEDFSIIVYALSNDLTDFQRNIVSQPKPKSVLNDFNENTLEAILKYRDIDSLQPEERQLIENIRNQNASIIKEFVGYLIEFMDYNWVIYTKIKHGNTLFMPYQKINVNGMDTFAAPVVYNKKHPEQVKVLLLNPFIYSRLQIMFDSLLNLMYQFCNANFEYISRGENGTFLTACYAPITDEEKAQYEQLIKKYNSKGNAYNINAIIEGNIDNKLVNKIFAFYQKCNLAFT